MSNRHMVGYVRVSMDDQSTSRQVAALIEYGVPRDDIFTDTASGKDMQRPGWEACWKDLRDGDLLVIHSLDRLGRNAREVLMTVEALHEKGADLKILTTPIDSREPSGELLITVMAGLAQYERRVINDRTKDGLRRAREAGRVGGAKPKHPDEAVMAAHAKWGIKEPGWKSLGMSKSGYIKAVQRIRLAADRARERKEKEGND